MAVPQRGYSAAEEHLNSLFRNEAYRVMIVARGSVDRPVQGRRAVGVSGEITRALIANVPELGGEASPICVQ